MKIGTADPTISTKKGIDSLQVLSSLMAFEAVWSQFGHNRSLCYTGNSEAFLLYHQ